MDTDDFFKDILNGEQFNLLDKNGEDIHSDNLNLSLCDWKPVTDDGSGVKEVIVGSASSTYSDSGLSCDQVSPGKFVFNILNPNLGRFKLSLFYFLTF